MKNFIKEHWLLIPIILTILIAIYLLHGRLDILGSLANLLRPPKAGFFFPVPLWHVIVVFFVGAIISLCVVSLCVASSRSALDYEIMKAEANAITLKNKLGSINEERSKVIVKCYKQRERIERLERENSELKHIRNGLIERLNKQNKPEYICGEKLTS